MIYLHGQNIIRGDLRSTNILLCHSEDCMVAKLADFAMARCIDQDMQCHLSISYTDEEYLFPKVFKHKQHKDPEEKWALHACSLLKLIFNFCFGEFVLEMVCGKLPTPKPKFSGQTMLTEVQCKDEYLSKLKQPDKDAFDLIIRRCLADTPTRRPPFTEILIDVGMHIKVYVGQPDLETLQDMQNCECLHLVCLHVCYNIILLHAKCERGRPYMNEWMILKASESLGN